MRNYLKINKNTRIVEAVVETTVPILDDDIFEYIEDIPLNKKEGHSYKINSDNSVIDLGMTIEFKIHTFTQAVSQYLDLKAQEKGYDNIINASLRAALPNSPYYAEGVAYGEWMDNIWDYCYTELDKIQQGLRSEPTIDEFILELPQLIL